MLNASNAGPHPPLPVTKLLAQMRRDAFIVELLANGFVAHKAAKALGISYATANKLKRDPYVLEKLNEAVDCHRAAKAITAQRILREYGRIAFTSFPDLLDENGKVSIEKLMGPAGAAVAEIVTTETADRDGNVTTKIRVKLHDKKGALDSLARNQGLLRDKVEIEGLDALAAELKAARERVENGDATSPKLVAHETKLLDV
jgi:hypothetical protein